MLLKSLELQGFKTFPDKTKLTFDKGITAVVGPNGSGKSNISDAIRWVLGEQSVKALRCSKMENIVFDGTDKRKSKGFAKVTLVIDNSDRRLNIDEDEVSVTRRYYRTGDSEYKLNGKNVRLKDLNELFMDTGLGRDGYSIIGQGKIDEIVSSKSGERREIFEEAAGISKFKYRKLESQKQLDKTEENLLRLNDIFKELEERVEPLREQSVKASKFLKYAQDKKDLQIGIWLDNLTRSEKLLKEQENKIFIAKEREAENNQKFEKVQKLLDDNYININNFSLNISKSRDELSLTEQNLSQTKNNIIVYKNDISHNEENISRLKDQITKLQEQNNTINSKIKSISEKKQSLLTSLDIIKDKIQTDSFKLENLSEQLKVNFTKQKDISDLLDKTNKNLVDKNMDMVRLASTIDDLNNKKIEYSQRFNALNKRLNDISSTAVDYQNIKNKITEKQTELKNNIETIYRNIELLQKDIDNENISKNQQLLLQNEKLKQAQILEELEKNMEGYSKSVKFVVKQAQQNYIHGIYSSVSKLIDVESHYRTALETALGASAQHIVCKDEQSAKQAIAILKQKNIGRATFLPVSVIKPRFFDDFKIKNITGFISMADKLCKTDALYENIISNLLSRVAIVDNIDNA
ncbi:MAG: AAA family ATPase, partial [Clostridia bacterium]|nr:AAA family ATPase [Clostridia bacterium]